jgi:hypothetical protein
MDNCSLSLSLSAHLAEDFCDRQHRSNACSVRFGFERVVRLLIQKEVFAAHTKSSIQDARVIALVHLDLHPFPTKRNLLSHPAKSS